MRLMMLGLAFDTHTHISDLADSRQNDFSRQLLGQGEANRKREQTHAELWTKRGRETDGQADSRAARQPEIQMESLSIIL